MISLSYQLALLAFVPVFFSSGLPSVTAFPLVDGLSSPVRLQKRAIDPSLILDFGFQSGINPTGSGDCDGIIPGGPKIPCQCPPPRDVFIQKLNADVEAGFAVNNPSVKVSFPTGSDLQSQINRITAHVITLQNLEGIGKGCPVISTNFTFLQEDLQAQLDAQRQNPVTTTTTPALATPKQTTTRTITTTVTITVFPAATAATSPPESKPSDLTPPPGSGSNISQLAPDLGWVAGVNPTGSGDCDSSKPGGLPKIPCQCPPARGEFIRQLEANVAAGKALKNPSVGVSFPLDDSNNSKRKRIIASLITLQNLEGPGKGCPSESTTLIEQMDAIPA